MKYILLITLAIFAAGAVQCLFSPAARPRWREYFRQQGIALDQWLNAQIPPFLTVSYADETMSARIWRGYRDGLIAGRLLMPPIDRLFGLWQPLDPAYVDEAGTPVGHCRRAFLKEKARRDYPPEYRDAPHSSDAL